jgi:hypothetical protein
MRVERDGYDREAPELDGLLSGAPDDMPVAGVHAIEVSDRHHCWTEVATDLVNVMPYLHWVALLKRRALRRNQANSPTTRGEDASSGHGLLTFRRTIAILEGTPSAVAW